MLTAETTIINRQFDHQNFDVVVNPKDCSSIFMVALAAADRDDATKTRLVCMEYDGVLIVGNTPTWTSLAQIAMHHFGITNPDGSKIGTVFSVTYDLEADTMEFASTLDAQYRARFSELMETGVLDRLFAENLLDEMNTSQRH